MNAPNHRDMQRVDELLADEASASLEAGDARELRALLDRNPGVRRDGLIQAAALAQVAFLHESRRTGARAGSTRMPAALRQRLASQGEAMVSRQRAAPTPLRPVPATGRLPVAGWLGWALAAMLAVALVIPRTEGPAPPQALDGAAARASLLAEAPDAVTLPWAVPTIAGYEGVRGDVVWSQSRQQGYLRLANMPVNDPARTQYQLWIVDPERDKHPVDGGVFDVSSTGEIVIPIRAKLTVRSPSAFAITAEQPGGVVVSAGPLLVVAAT